MKINFILANAKISGGIRMIFQYANYLIEKGHKVICYYPRIGCHTGRFRIFANVYQLYFINNENEGDWFERKFELRNPTIIDDDTVEDGDIVFATLWGTCKWVQRLSGSKGEKAYFIQGFEIWYNKYRNKQVLDTYCMNWEIVISVSNALRLRLLKEVGLDSKVVCNGISDKEIRTYKRNYEDKRNVVIGFPYREEEQKNCIFASELLCEIKRSRGSVHVISYGLKKPAEWSEDFEFLENPTREQLFDFYEKTDIFYVPSLYEGWGLPAVEAMGHACAVVASDTGAIAEFGIDGQNCIIVKDPKDKQEIRRKLEYLIDFAEDRIKIGNNAWELVKEKYLFEKQAEKFEQALQRSC